jgi:hypothetical protein
MNEKSIFISSFFPFRSSKKYQNQILDNPLSIVLLAAVARRIKMKMIFFIFFLSMLKKLKKRKKKPIPLFCKSSDAKNRNLLC